MHKQLQIMTLKVFIFAMTSALFTELLIAQGIERLNPDSIGVEILGTIAAKDPKEGVALLKLQKTGKVTAVRRNYIVEASNGIKYLVKEVYPESMIVFSKGTKYIIPKDKFSTSATTVQVAENSNSLPKKLALQENYSEPGFERKKNQDGNSEIRITSAYKKKMLGNLQTILMQASAIPYQENGKIVGFQLLQIDEDSIYSKAGIVDNDVVTSINGHPLTDAASAIKLLKSLKKEDQIEFEIMRDGKFTTSSINVE